VNQNVGRESLQLEVRQKQIDPGPLNFHSVLDAPQSVLYP
jgi:hypothetical protein